MSRRLSLLVCWFVLGFSLLSLLREVAHMDGWRDHGLFYYAPRLIVKGENAYDWDRMKAEWRADGKPTGVDPGTTMSGFVNPPSMALLTLPPSLAPPQFALRAMDAWNLVALAVCILCLTTAAARAWPLEARILFAAYCCWLPAVHSVLLLGQSTLLISACLAAALLALAWQKEVAGGVLIGLALAKFTLSFPFIAVLVYRRNWKAAGVAIATFLFLNIVLALPFGPANTVHAYRTVVTRETRPGSSYDALTSDPRWMPQTLVHAPRLLVLLLGRRRKTVAVANIIICVGIAVALAFGLRRRQSGARRDIDPLEAAALVTAALLLFYHRNYDVAVLILIVYGLIDYGIRKPSLRGVAWKLGLFVSLLLSWIVPAGLAFVFNGVGGPTERGYVICSLIFVLFWLLQWQLVLDRDVTVGTTLGVDGEHSASSRLDTTR